MQAYWPATAKGRINLQKISKQMTFVGKTHFLYHLLEVRRGLGRSGNVSERLWDILEVFYIDHLNKNEYNLNMFEYKYQNLDFDLVLLKCFRNF